MARINLNIINTLTFIKTNLITSSSKKAMLIVQASGTNHTLIQKTYANKQEILKKKTNIENRFWIIWCRSCRYYYVYKDNILGNHPQ